ncbi:MFS transporter [Calditerricola satsumensis]|uniref:MFS transporter n=2 Tax=Calditerricola satsumensis TaxID=373054 RepID=A0A8J3FBY3_9BACI|nr:MFS transporter [Calditerricola satsumensis]GGK06695.1 MFS transporter [Calditerricola satsumensis]
MKSRPFALLLASQAASGLADALAIVAVVTWVYRLTGSALASGFYPVLRVLAMAVAGWAFGRVLERANLMAVLVAAQGTQAALFAALAAGVVTLPSHPATLGFVLAMVFAAAFADGWTTPARGALVPRLVPQAQWVHANSVLATADQVVLLIGWLIGGLLVARWGETMALGLTVALYGAATAALAVLARASLPRETGPDPASPPPAPGRASRSGWAALWRLRPLRPVVTMDAVENLAYGVWTGALMLAYVQEALGRSSVWWGYLNAGYYGGTLLGGLLVWRAARAVERRLVASLVAGALCGSVMTLAFALTSSPAVALVLCLLMGPAFQVRDVAQRTLMQHSVDPLQLPVVLAAHGILVNAAFALSVLVMGWVADAFGIRAAYGMAAAVSALAVVLALLLGLARWGRFGDGNSGKPGALLT